MPLTNSQDFATMDQTAYEIIASGKSVSSKKTGDTSVKSSSAYLSAGVRMLKDAEEGQGTDLRFLVGPKGQVFHAHSLIVSYASDFLKAMIDERWNHHKEDHEFVLPEEDPIVFRILLKMMYGWIPEPPLDEATLRSFIDLLQKSVYYQSDTIKIGLGRVLKRINVPKFPFLTVELYQTAMELQVKNVTKILLPKLAKNFYAITKREEWLDEVNESTLEALLGFNGSVFPSELALYKEVIRWIKHHTVDKNSSGQQKPSGKNKRKKKKQEIPKPTPTCVATTHPAWFTPTENLDYGLVQKLLPNIRFTLLDNSGWNEVLRDQVLSPEQIVWLAKERAGMKQTTILFQTEKRSGTTNHMRDLGDFYNFQYEHSDSTGSETDYDYDAYNYDSDYS